jgi:O-succinylbenzoic acid--CoA ligase
MALTLTIVVKRSLHAVLLNGPGDAARLIEPLAAALDGSGPAILPLDAGHPGLAALLDAYRPNVVTDGDGVTTVRSEARGTGGDTAVIISTSGTTGEPKGVELSAAALLGSARASLTRIGAVPGERWVCCLPVTHVAGIQVLVRSLAAGTEPVIADRVDAGVLARSGAAHVSLVPAQLRRLLDERASFDGFRSVLLGGAAAPETMLEQAREAQVPLITTYGMTETCGGCVYDGRPLDGVSVTTDGGGRLVIGGPVLFTRYTGQPPRTGPFVTSDLGNVDKSGLVRVRGRADDVINTGGHKVLPGEVAHALQDCPGVREVVVVGRPDPKWGERVTAVVVPADPGDPPDLKLLRNHVQGRLPRYAFPGEIELRHAIPLLPTGKPDLVRLRREHSPARSVTY